ncbi:MAG: DUF1674 domain-containing protein [Rhizobiaceae bacterium]
MSEEETPADPVFRQVPVEGRPLSPAARRALEEAARRREAYSQAEAGRPRELGGRGGLEPARYGDWEIKGIASDF